MATQFKKYITQKRAIILVLLILLLHALWLRAYSITHVPLQLDDNLWLHTGWRVYVGDILYRDFFAIHTPLTFYITALAFVVSGETTDAIFAERYILLVLYIGILLVTYLLARKTLNSKTLSLFSVVILAYGSEPLLIEHILLPSTIPIILFGISGIYMLVAGYKNSRLFLFLSGVFLSLAFFSHQKALFFVLAVPTSLFVLAVSRAREKRNPLIRELNSEIKHALPILLGMISVAIPIFAYFYLNGALYDFLYYAGPLIASRQQDFSYVESSYSTTVYLIIYILRSPIIWVVGGLMALTSFVSIMDRLKKRKAIDHIEVMLTMSIWTIVVGVYLLLRFQYSHEFFFFSPILSIYAVKLFDKNFRVTLDDLRSQAGNYIIAILFVFLVIGIAIPAVKTYNFYVSDYYSPNYNYALDRQIRYINYLNNITDPEDKIYGDGFAIFRKSPYYYWWHGRFGSDEEFIESLKRERVKVISAFFRGGNKTATEYRTVSEKTKEFVKDNYILDKFCIKYAVEGGVDFYAYVAGKNITPHDFSGCGIENNFLVCSNSTAYATYYLIADANYEMWVTTINNKDGGKLNVYVDGNLINSTDTRVKWAIPTTNRVYMGRMLLTQGAHNVTLAGQDGDVIVGEMKLKMATPDVNLCYPDLDLYWRRGV